MSAPRYPIRAVARLTGLSPDTLRAWERRYTAVAPRRGERGRLYTDAEVKRLGRLAALVDSGHAIGDIARQSDEALARLSARVGRDSRTAAPAQIDLEMLLRAVRQLDLRVIDSVLNHYAVLLPAEQLVFAVVLPVLREVGARWESSGVRPAHEHLVSAVVRSVLGGMLRTAPRPAHGPALVLATVSGERHELGLLSAAVLAARAGWEVFYLGPDLPAADIVHAAARLDATAVLVSATATDGNAADLLVLKRLAPAVSLWAGGPRAAQVRAVVGSRVREVDTLEDLHRLVERHER